MIQELVVDSSIDFGPAYGLTKKRRNTLLMDLRVVFEDPSKNVTITAEMVSRLRDETDEPLMRCKNALMKCGGDHSEAVEYLRTRSG